MEVGKAVGELVGGTYMVGRLVGRAVGYTNLVGALVGVLDGKTKVLTEIVGEIIPPIIAEPVTEVSTVFPLDVATDFIVEVKLPDEIEATKLVDF